VPLTYLLHLEHVRLPLHVTDAQDVRRVSVLKATGLVEAEIDPAFDPGGNYRLAQAALVVCITDDGHAEIESLRKRKRRREEGAANARAHKKRKSPKEPARSPASPMRSSTCTRSPTRRFRCRCRTTTTSTASRR
jgi:hypothetical protein